jgi:hypothetical protein
MPPGNLPPGMGNGAPPPPPALDANGQPVAPTTNILTMVCRAVDLSKTSGDASANSEIAYAVEGEIKNCPLVNASSTSLIGNIVPDDSNGTFTFTVNVAPTNAPTFTPGNSPN